jgi:hypothetical protein
VSELSTPSWHAPFSYPTLPSESCKLIPYSCLASSHHSHFMQWSVHSKSWTFLCFFGFCGFGLTDFRSFYVSLVFMVLGWQISDRGVRLHHLAVCYAIQNFTPETLYHQCTIHSSYSFAGFVYKFLSHFPARAIKHVLHKGHNTKTFYLTSTCKCFWEPGKAMLNNGFVCLIVLRVLWKPNIQSFFIFGSPYIHWTQFRGSCLKSFHA